MAKNAEHAALLAQRVAFEIVLKLMLNGTVGEGMVSVLVQALCLVHFASLLARAPNPKEPGVQELLATKAFSSSY